MSAWYRTKKRQYPWRVNRTPYRVLVAELMLRRTRADQVSSVFEQFIETYPDMIALRRAPAHEIRHALEPLGLTWRADNIVELAREVGERYGGDIPRSRNDLLALPGVGPYVAGAVRCFAFEECESIADTNIVRIVGRFFGISLHGEARRRKEMLSAVEQCVPDRDGVNYHFALIDFGAKICRARKPQCTACCLSEKCRFFLDSLPDDHS